MAHATVGALDVGTFVDEFLTPGRPVLVREALAGCAWAPPWDLPTLTERFGDYRVPLYDTLFALQGLSTFRDYVAHYTGGAVTGTPPYLRWFTRQSPDRMPWADAAFTQLARDWSMPGWLPRSGYLFPASSETVDVTRDAFPAKGLFVCGRGGRTRLHADPWVSDACLCQTTGDKRVVMYPPAAGELLTTDDGSVVDLDAPDDQAFPRWREAEPAFDEVLHPGDAVFIPAGWYHTAIALDDSVSITWNFVHEVHEARFGRYLASGGDADPTVRFFRQ